MASFSYGFTVHCEGKQEDVDAFLESAEYAENWTQSDRVSADSLSLYKEETRDNPFYAPFKGLIEDYPDLRLFFELKAESNSLDNSKQCGYAIFADGELAEEAYFTYGYGNKVHACLAEWRGEPAPEEETRPAEPLAELSDDDYEKAVDEYDSTGDFVDMWDGYKTPRFCLYVAGRNPEMLDFMPEQSKTREVCLTACRENSAALQFLPASLQTPDFYCEAFLGESAGKTSAEFRKVWAFNRYVPKDAQEPVLRLLFSEEDVDENNIEASLEYKKWRAKVERHALLYFRGVPEKFKTPALCLSVVKQDAETLKYVPEQLKTQELCLAAITQKGEGSALEFVPDALKTPELCQAALDNTSRYSDYAKTLSHIPDRVKTPEMCRAVVMKDASALEFVPDAFKTPEFCAPALKNNGWALRYIPDALKTPELCIAAITQDGYALRYVPDALKTGAQGAELCRIALENDGLSLEYTPDSLKTGAQGAELCRIALENNADALEYAPAELREQIKQAAGIA